jgi:hypothetical protein
LFLAILVGGLGVFGCAASEESTPDAGGGADLGTSDGGARDAAMSDTGTDEDAAVVDAGLDAGARDLGPRPDAGMCNDLPAEPTRPVAIQCSPCRPPGEGGGSGGGLCATDADCVDGDNGRCSFGRGGPTCDYDTCFKDEDCGADKVCLCDGASSGTGGGNTCISANCRVDADCGAFTCSPTLGSCGHYTNFVAYRCHTATDSCATDADCGVGYCAFDEVAGNWACSSSECAG